VLTVPLELTMAKAVIDYLELDGEWMSHWKSHISAKQCNVDIYGKWVIRQKRKSPQQDEDG
jgi:hypothetical protein